MSFAVKFKQFFLNSFRELFVYHHNSLEFRAKLFATLIVADDKSEECYFEKVEILASLIYKDTTRQETLLLTTIEYVNKAKLDNGLGIDELIYDIIDTLKVTPRYYKKIDINQLNTFLECSQDADSRSYQENILHFFDNLKKEKKGVS